MKTIKQLILLLLFTGGSLSAWSQAPYMTVLDAGTIGHTDLNGMLAGGSYLRVDLSNPGMSGAPCPTALVKTDLSVKLDLGEDFAYAGLGFDYDLSLRVELIDGGGGWAGPPQMVNLKINAGQPEGLFLEDLGVMPPFLDHLKIFVQAYSSVNAGYSMIDNDLRLSLEGKSKVIVSNPGGFPVPAPLSPVVGSNTRFSWSFPCEAPSYELQLLRLYNHSLATSADSSVITPVVDWKYALSVEVEGTEVDLRLASGTGYYVYRVRPIFNAYNGGIADSRNWGGWSLASVPATVTGAVGNHLFFFEDPNQEHNYQYQRSFDASFNSNEGMVFYSSLLQQKQSQARQYSDNRIQVKQEVEDYNGQNVLQSLPAPVAGTDFAYLSRFLQNGSGDLYTADDFDSDSKYLSPTPIVSGPLGEYYSDANPDLQIANAGGYPYTRTRYLPDGTGRVSEQSGLGANLTIGTKHTNTYLYTDVADREITRVFGKEAPSRESVTKTIHKDPNGTTKITYLTKTGKTLATCLSRSRASALPDLYPVSPISIKDTLKGGFLPTPNASLNTRKLVFTDTTQVDLSYGLIPDSVELDCQSWCSTCEYRVYVRVRDIDQDKVVNIDSLYVPPSSCASPPTGLTKALSQECLPFVNYQVEKWVHTRNLVDGTGAITLDPQNGRDVLLLHSEELNAAFDAEMSSILTSLENYLEDADLEGFYTYLGGLSAASFDPLKDEWTLNTNCCSLTLPQIECDTYDCSSPVPAFGQYYLDHFLEQVRQKQEEDDLTTSMTALLSSLEAHLSGGDLLGALLENPWSINEGFYTVAYLDSLASNMLADPSMSYDCEALWKCWEASCQGALSQFLNSYDNKLAFNPVRGFLDCAGYKFRGVGSGATGSKGYLTKAHAYFHYASPSPACESGLGYNPSSPWPMDGDLFPCDPNLDPACDPFINRPWDKFYHCVRYGNTGEPPLHSPRSIQKEQVSACLNICESRRGAFELEAVALFDSTSTPYTPEDLKCVVDMMVEHCEGNCEMTLFYASGPDNPVYNIPRGHVPPGALNPGELYRLHVLNPDVYVWLEYEGVYYSPFGRLGDDFYATGSGGGSYSILASPGAIPGVDWQVLQDVSSLDSLGSQAQFKAWMQASTWAFEIDFPAGAVCSSPDATLLSSMSYFPALNLIANPPMDKSSACSSLPAAFGGACNANWQASHGSPQTIEELNAAFADRSGAATSYLNVLPTGDTVVRGDGLMTEGWLSLTAGQKYILEFDFRKEEGFEDADQIFALLDPRDDPMTSATEGIFPYFGVEAPSPTLSGQVIWTEEEVGPRNWRKVSVTFTAAQSGWFELVLYPMQDRGKKTGVTTGGLFEEPNGFERVTKIVFDNVYLYETVAQNCMDICFRWFAPALHDSVVPDTIHYPTCEEDQSRHLRNLLASQSERCKKSQRRTLEAAYAASCPEPNDYLALEYQLEYYHYTLFYHDLAGRLIRTVPPKGVDINDSFDRDSSPMHTFETYYGYDSYNNQVYRKTPDGGSSFYYYDRLGRVRFSQDAKQQLEGSYAYVKYDRLGRIAESGLSVFDPHLIADPATAEDETFPGSALEWSRNHYDLLGSVTYPGGGEQRFLQNRLSWTENHEGARTHFSYDPHGNIEWLAQEIPGYESGGAMVPVFIAYDYDPVSGVMEKISYNEGFEDQFFQTYSYDADQRLTEVLSSVDGKLWETEVRQSYNPDGTVDRVVFGEDRLQGLDLTYTIQGWLKGINHADLGEDPGEDGTGSSEIPKDLFGMVLGYFEGDYNRSYSGNASSFNSVSGSAHASTLFDGNYYNGDVASWTDQVAFGNGSNQYEQLTGRTFSYDKLGRLTKSDFNYKGGSSWSTTADYASAYAYDANGNLTQLKRNTFGGNRMDSLRYHYPAAMNRLNYIDDKDGQLYAAGIQDLPDQSSGNYLYDAIGQLSKDQSEGIDTILWNSLHKVERIVKNGGMQIIDFAYNGNGERIRKDHADFSGGSPVVTTTLYLRDGNGRVFARYSQENGGGINLEEQSIYAGKRVGLYKADHEITPGASSFSGPVSYRNQGVRRYELSDHLGNSRVVFGDRKLPTISGSSISFSADTLSYYHYYPYGMQMPGRTFESESYTYGFNGMEKDEEIKGQGNSYDFTARFLDPRVGRWLSTDPQAASFPSSSPYRFAGDNPTSMVDPDGEAEYSFHVRAFAPSGAFYFTEFPLHDDGRGFSTSTNVTNRMAHEVRVDFSNRTKVRENANSSPTILDTRRPIDVKTPFLVGAGLGLVGGFGTYYLQRRFNGQSRTAAPAYHSQAAFSTTLSGNTRLALSTSTDGKMPWSPQGLTPPIHGESNIIVELDQSQNQLNIEATYSSSDFPAFEGFIEDEMHTRVFLGASPAYGTPYCLSEATRVVSQRSLTINLDINGRFDSVIFNGKTMSISAYNAQVQSQSAGPFARPVPFPHAGTLIPTPKPATPDVNSACIVRDKLPK